MFGSAEVSPLDPGLHDAPGRKATLSFVWIRHNPLKHLDSDEGTQENPRNAKPGFLRFPWSGLEKLGPRRDRGAGETRPGRRSGAQTAPQTVENIDSAPEDGAASGL